MFSPPELTPVIRSSPLLVTPEDAKDDPFTGSISYSYAIGVPPGTGEATPRIALSYSSLTRATEYGWGWSLGPISRISRSTRRGPPAYTAADRMELDGELLVPDPRAGRFHRERTRFERIEFTSSADGGSWTVTSPDGTRRRYGARAAANSRLVNPNEWTADGDPATLDVFAWYLDEVVDPRGNSFRIDYCSDATGDCHCTTADGQCPAQPAAVRHLYPSSIAYSFREWGNPGPEQASRRVSFVWEPRAAGSEAEDRPTDARGGFLDQITKRLAEIRTSVNGRRVARYALSYFSKPTSAVTGYAATAEPPFSKLKSIQRHGEGDADRFPSATAFDYSRDDRGASASADGFPADPETWTLERAIRDTSTSTTYGSIAIASTADLDGDGLVDRLSTEYGLDGWQVMYGRAPTAQDPARFEAKQPWKWCPTDTTPNEECSEVEPQGASPDGSSSGPEDPDHPLRYPAILGFVARGLSSGTFCNGVSDVQLIDMDGDGADDYVEIYQLDDVSSGEAPILGWRVRKNLGYGFGPPRIWGPPTHADPGYPPESQLRHQSHRALAFQRGGPCLNADAAWSRLIDLDGDGRTDHLHAPDSSRWSLALNRGCEPSGDPGDSHACGFHPALTLENMPATSLSSDGSRDQADVNADGLPDLIMVENGCIHVYYNVIHQRWSPGGTFMGIGSASTCGLPFPRVGPLTGSASSLQDVNGDGWLDWIAIPPGGPAKAYLGLGDGRFSSAPLDVYTHLTSTDAGPVDFEGDGLSELVEAWEPPKSWKVRSRGLPPGLLTRITNELGGVTSVEYASTANFIGTAVNAARPEYAREDLSGTSIGKLRNHYWVAAEIRVSDGRSGTAPEVRSLSYAQPRHDAARRENHGFRMTEVTKGGVVQRSILHQSRELRGRVQLEETLVAGSGSDTVYRGRAFEWAAWVPRTEERTPRPITGARFPALLREIAWIRDPQSGREQVRTTGYEYDDQFGNLLWRRDHGPDGLAATSADNGAWTEYRYAPRTERAFEGAAEWLIQHPSEVIRAHAGQVLEHTRWSYDQQGWPAAARTGLVSARERLVSNAGAGEWVREEWEHDVFGNPTHYRNGERVRRGDGPDTLRVVYGPDYNSFPEAIVNAALHVTAYRFDPVNGEVVRRLDPNGLLECWSHDSFQRLRERRRHSHERAVPLQSLDTTSCDPPLGSLVASFEYLDFGTPNAAETQRIVTNEYPGQGPATSSVRYFDGRGRTYADARPIDGGMFVVQARAWGPRGEEACTALPRKTRDPSQSRSCGSAPPYRSKTYDPLLRPLEKVLHTPSDAVWGEGSFSEETLRYAIEDARPDVPGLEVVETLRIDASFPGGTASPALVRRVARDADGWVVSVEDTLGNRTSFDRDRLGRITLIDGEDVRREGGGTHRNRLAIEYDLLGRRLRLIGAADDASPPRGPTWEYAWDHDDNLVRQVPPRGAGQAVNFHYDALGRMLLKDLPPNGGPGVSGTGGPEDTYFVYDQSTRSRPGTGAIANLGFLTFVGSPGAVTDREFDRRGNLIWKERRIAGRPYEFVYEYDQLERRTYARYPDQVGLEFAYAGSVLASVRNRGLAQTYVTGVTYHPNGQLEQLWFESDPANPVSSHYEIDAGTLRLTRGVARAGASLANGAPSGGSVLDGTVYAYDRAGNLRSVSAAPESGIEFLAESFEYDPLHRLYEARSTGIHAYAAESYRYDAAGNLVEKGPWTLAYARGDAPAHAVTALSGGSARLEYGYDADGNLVSRSGGLGGPIRSEALRWDAEGRLAGISSGGSTRAEYRYDDSGLRVLRQTTHGGTHVDPEFEVDASGRRIKHVFIADRRVLSLIDEPDRDATGDGVPDRYECDGHPAGGYDTPAAGDASGFGIPDACLCGDFNGDGQIGVADLIAANACIYDPDRFERAALHDATGDGECRVDDIVAINHALFSSACRLRCGEAGAPDRELRQHCLDASAVAQDELRFHWNQVGSNRLVTDHRGEVVQRNFTKPFGELHVVVDGGNPPAILTASGERPSDYIYTDKHADHESGFHYFGMRYYDPLVGRFVSMDPALIGPRAGPAFAALEEATRYFDEFAYAANDPVNGDDPSGRFVEFDSKVSSETRGLFQAAWDGSPQFRQDYMQLATSPETYTVVENSGGSYFDASGVGGVPNAIGIDAHQGVETESGGVQGPVMGVVHEVSHAATKDAHPVLFIQGVRDVIAGKPENEEERATAAEMGPALALGEGVRKDYADYQPISVLVSCMTTTEGATSCQ